MWFWVVALILAGCQNATVGTGGSSCSGIGSCLNAGTGGGTGSGSGIPSEIGMPVESPFYLSIKSYWENDTGKAFPTSYDVKLISKNGSGVLANTGTAADLSSATCQVDPGTLITDSDDKRVITCGVEIPETQLFFSSLDFQINVGKDAECDVVYYWPYGYQASTSASFTSRWQASALDCTVSPTPLACYSGPWIDISGFPAYTGNYRQIYDKTKTHSEIFSVPSANTKLRQDNRWTSYRPTGDIRNWEWECAQKGSSLNFGVTLRVIPKKDDPFNSGGPRWMGWLDDDGNDRGFAGQ